MTTGQASSGAQSPSSTTQTDPAALREQLTAIARSLTLEQQVRLLTGADMWSTHAEPAVGLRSMVLSDGPSGVRGQIWDERDPSLNLPSATALSASWDPELAYRYGAAAAAEAVRKGVDVVLGPTINLHRSPLGGRHFEAYSEDPLLTGEIGAAFVRGVQSAGVAACPKHYIANDFETERFTASVEVSDQALREVYLAPFERTVHDGGAWTVMSSYNAVRGVTMSENDLLRSPLCQEWGFDGVVVSDWTAVRSIAAARARQDLAMPGPDGPWGQALVAAVRAGEVPAAEIEEKVRRLLLLAVRVGALGAEPPPPPRPVIDAGFAREVEARGIVLVRNTDGLLPLRAPASIAVSGQSAGLPRTQGGGSATVLPSETISPLTGLRQALPATTVSHCLGAIVEEGIAELPLNCLTDPETGSAGLRVRIRDSAGDLVLDELRFSSALVWLGNAPVGDLATLELVTDYRPAVTGPVELGFAVIGPTVLSIDGVDVLQADNDVTGQDPASAVLSPPASTAEVDLQAGRGYRLRVLHSLAGTPRQPGALGITLGSRPATGSADALIAEAAEAAREAEVAVVVVGTNSQVESEGFDRGSLALPGRQDDLVRAVAAANPQTVVVVNSGSPVTMPWRSQVRAVLLTWFGGQEYGRALADVLTGAVEPGGRLPTSWPAEEADVPVIDVRPVDGVLRYDEGIHIGYRAWLRAGVEPAYPFGFGLGYTSFDYESLTVAVPAAAGGDGGAEVSIRLSNTGPREGREVAQVYLSRPESAHERPVRWLAGFAGVTVPAGQSATVTIALPRRAFEHWQADGWALEPGGFTVQAGPNVADLPLRAEFSPQARLPL
ncbi:MAG TPA: glycoside hydrolase family 3 C-terminal domain-containing protein [Jatrophihabitans sp.]|uniref:beta-glucosidase n=1 Tax=Jatrophihabitans sp. TaxID=1932789 RepID=UPI002F0DD6F1